MEEDVQACNIGNGGGPGVDLRLDFSRGYLTSRWNRIILERVYRVISDSRKQQNGWNLPDVSEEYIMGELYGQLKRAQEAWALVQPRFLPHCGQLESPEQVTKRVESYYSKRVTESGSRALRMRVSGQAAT
jgi:hypothetical protein